MNANGSKWIRRDKRLSIYLRDGFECGYCGRDLHRASAREVTLDHLLPRSAGGGNEATNLTTACLACNSSRQDKPWASYATGGAVERIEQRRHQPLPLDLARALLDGTAGDEEVEMRTAA